MLLSSLQVIGHHFGAHLLYRDLRRPAQLGLGFGWITQQGFHLGGTEVARVDPYEDLSGRERWSLITLDAVNNGNFVQKWFDEFEQRDKWKLW